MATLRAILAAVLVPIAGIILAIFIQRELGAEPGQIAQAALACATGGAPFAACAKNHYTPGLLALSSLALPFGLGILLVYKLAAMLCGANRLALAFVFPPVTFLTLLAIAALTLMHAGIVGLGFAAAESHWFASVHEWVLIAVVLLGILAACAVAWASIRSFGAAQISVVGFVINPMDQPRLMLAVRKLAKEVGAPAPDQVVVGMDANFFVTNAQVHLPGVNGFLRGKTMFLSAPLMRGLTADELKAVIAHELSHYAHQDLAYSSRFAPIFTRLAAANGDPANGPKRNNPFLIPVRLFTDYMANTFQRNVAAVSRTREFAADERAAAATSPQDVATSLLKVSILTDIWQREFGAMLERVQAGRFSRNLSRNFEDQIRYDLDRRKVGDMMSSVLAWHTPHPTDSHPPTDERIGALGLNAETLTGQAATFETFFGRATAAQELDDLNDIEETLTFVYQKIMVEMGVGATKELDQAEVARRVLIDFIAHMITADGVVAESEIEIAEKEARHLVEDFDPRDLRERCRHPDDLIEVDKLTEIAIDLLTPQGFKRLAAALEKVSKADGMQDKSEQWLLQRVLAAAELATEE